MLVISEETPHEAALYHWGLIPHWAKDPKIGNRLINARAETVAEKPAFRDPFKSHRCLVLADGFYEWDKKSAKHTPYRITLKNKQPFAFAGICDSWHDNQGKEIKSFSIITTKANKIIEKIHDRMPVILHEEEEKEWLNAELETMRLKKLLDSYPAEEIEMQEISTLINNPRNDTRDVILPVN